MVSLRHKFRNIYRKNKDDLIAIMAGHYPEFIYRSIANIKKNYLPIFVFHSVQPDIFEQKVEYITRNGYKTLNSEQVHALITEGKGLKEKQIVLTFDDGCGSLWTTAYPILKKYNQRAICFLVTGEYKISL